MNVLIVGCGQTARRVALELCMRGHEVSVLGDDTDRLKKLLSMGYTGQITQGISIDRDDLSRAGAQSADLLIAITPDDNSNLMIAQIANAFFNIDRVITRVSNTEREDIFQQHGLDTICPTRIIADTFVSAALVEKTERQTAQFSNCTMGFETRLITDLMSGRYVDEYKLYPDEAVIGIQHEDGRVTLAGSGKKRLLMRQGEKLIIARVVD